MREPEFYANATLGFRQWHPAPGFGEHEPLYLQSMVRQGLDRPRYRWSLQDPNRASCSRPKHPKFRPGSLYASHGEVPAPGCSCGFYAYGRRDGSGSETSVHVVGGVVAGWGNLELHERGFRCSVAKVLALFGPDLRREHADYDGVAPKKWAALKRMCAENAVPLLPPDALRDDEEVRRYARERDLLLLEDQLGFRGFPSANTESY